MTLLTFQKNPARPTTAAPDTPPAHTAPATHTAPAAPPAPPAPDPATSAELTRLLFHQHDHDHDRWRALVSTPDFAHTPHLSDTERIAQSYRRLRLVNDQLDAAALAADVGRLTALHEWIGPADGGTTTAASIHYNLFLGSLIDHHDTTPPRDLTPYTTLQHTGTFLCTELDHGNDATHLQTTATHDPTTGGFTLHTPTPGAQKFMPNTSLTGGPKTALVAARLITHDGHDHGIHLFLTPLSDHTGHLPGITVRPLPPTDGPLIDHCLTSFHHVHLPHHALLQGDHARLTPDGTHHSTLGNHRKRFLTTISRVTTGKLCMSAGTLGMARAALTIAVHHAHTRHTTGPKPGHTQPIADHRTHHAPLINHLATTYAMTFLHHTLVDRWAHHTPTNQTDTERDIAIAKGWITWQARDIATQCRERCGAAGLFPTNHLTNLTRNIEGGITAEGDNLLIWTKAAAELLLTQPTPPTTPNPNHHPHNNDPHHHSDDPHPHYTYTPHPGHNPNHPIPPNQPPLTHLPFLRNLLAHLQTLHHTRARTALRHPATNPTQRWNHTAPHALTLTATHAPLQATDAFLTTINNTTHTPTKTHLQNLCTLFLLNQITPHTGDLLTHHHLHPTHIHNLPHTTNHLHHTLHPHLTTLTHAHQHPTHTTHNLNHHLHHTTPHPNHHD
ncbi:acyl-CoA dehydrogenase, partial [Streptomyces sp. NPDC050659]